ncbi:protein MHF2 homolog isoform X1 [Carya illinoinensis]|uniref:Centromere protein X n=1 Tax=Carya illinoinensis TaxID=32201 RepID=A0A8T1NS49_CARIL|nr:protein MHF2 homolog isoform X1 [Carya illinoinensis]XP_042953295.1 protein MHF2 homolog isoform X1 [Carya illinoinensis]XP_042953296.1 protein MHF2 homolog isoform X1 [Carya illinoinensis]KAG6633219.1 hypothetical protein CIPAW_12G033600 [Carya illinoinensis]KAG6633220.1 hypothetical protein CIPAW_12G033600 [Carya illinoinensis]KAG6633223.1 hypothetical protein CIPAW_12G033600 [Carya illinoinensis]KAG6633225.1 hypothetical protein CIPAW_12G033600 [Carya illinoinensis]
MEDANTFDPDLVHAIFKLVWNRRALERERNEGADGLDIQEKIVLRPNGLVGARSLVDNCVKLVGAGASKKNRPTYANANALKLSCELLRIFVTEAVQRAATIAEAEGVSKIEATHLERILPQLLLDF